jgi:hypothetical protein
MAKYTVTRSCGHEETIQLIGKIKDRDWRLEHVEASKLCYDCWQKELARQREEEHREAAEVAREQHLPALIGTEKQIPWAESVRQLLLAAIDEFIYRYVKAEKRNDPKLLEAVERIKNKTEARWWIDHRGADTSHEIERLLEEVAKEAKVEQMQPPPEIVANAKAEATVRPEHSITETVAEIRALENSIDISFPERRDDFRELVKKRLKMAWKDKWIRNLKPQHGTPADRAAEAGHCLLEAGFPIRIFDQAIREKAVFGDYEPEHTRWVMGIVSGDHSGWFSIRWSRDEDFYQAARKIPGSRYSKPVVVVPPEQFEQVLDFARMYDFRISEKAREIADTARLTRDNMLVAKVGPGPEQEYMTPLSKPPILEVPEHVSIADEFKD